MRQLIAIALLPLLLAGAALGSFDARELQKLPNVVAHYQHHRSEHGEPNLTFIEFLADHYGASTDQDSEHEHLPLLGSLSSASMFVPHLEKPSLDCTSPLVCRKSISPDIQQQILSTVVTDVFQPPRQV